MGLFKIQYINDIYYDYYIRPNYQILKYGATNRDVYREYKTDPNIYSKCPCLNKWTSSKNHIKAITLHIKADCIEKLSI